MDFVVLHMLFAALHFFLKSSVQFQFFFSKLGAPDVARRWDASLEMFVETPGTYEEDPGIGRDFGDSMVGGEPIGV